MNKCKDPACNPVFQLRGEMGKGDYFGVLDDVGDPDEDHYAKVELNEGNRNDCRIACRTCFLQTPWSLRDVPNMPGVGVQYVEGQWTKLVEAKEERKAMFLALREQFGDAAILRHLGHSMQKPGKIG